VTKSPPRICIVTTYPIGGAGTAAVRLVDALKGNGVLAGVVSAGKSGNEELQALPGEAALLLNRRWRERLCALDSERKISGFFSASQASVTTDWLRWRRDFDVVHLHWAHDFALPEFMVEDWPVHLPLVITLHDQGWFTGGCHYSGDCRGFVRGCPECPMVPVGYYPAVADLAKKRASAYDTLRPLVIAPSRWLKTLASQSLAFANCEVVTIPYPLDTDQWQVFSRAEALTKLDLDPDIAWVMMIAERQNEVRKGFAAGLEAMGLLAAADPERRIGLLLVGKSGAKLELPLVGVRNFGKVTDTGLLNTIYSASTCLLHPATEDNQPLVVLEAMACARPVVSAPCGGTPELIVDSGAGFVASSHYARDLAVAVERILALNDSGKEMGERGRLHLLKHHTPAQVANAHRAIYESLLENAKAAPSDRTGARRALRVQASESASGALRSSAINMVHRERHTHRMMEMAHIIAEQNALLAVRLAEMQRLQAENAQQRIESEALLARRDRYIADLETEHRLLHSKIDGLQSEVERMDAARRRMLETRFARLLKRLGLWSKLFGKS